MSEIQQNQVTEIDEAQELRNEDTLEFTTFFYNDHLFGLPIDEVIEINRALDVTPVPLAPDYVAGVVNLRGQILTAINLAKRLGLSNGDGKEQETSHNNVITGNREEPISLLVQKIGDVISVPKSQIEPPPDTIAGVDRNFVKFVCKLPRNLLMVLDREALENPEKAGYSGMGE